MSNFAPSDTQRRVINTILNQQLHLAETVSQAAERAKGELERVTEEVDRVARRFEEVKAIQKFAAHSFAIISRSHDDLKAAIARLKMTLHPIHQLPNELLAQIFRTFAKSLQGDYLDEFSWRGSLQCLVLGAICQRWRVVAQSTRDLWSDIPLCVCRPSSAVISTQLARLAQGQNLQIMFTDVKDDGTNPSEALHSLLRSVKPLDVSITSLFMRFCSPKDLRVLEKWTFTAHSVKSLSIQTQAASEHGVVPPSFFRHVGNASILSLCDTITASSISLTPVKVLNVNSYFETLSPGELRRLCLQLPSLETLRIEPSIIGTIWMSKKPMVQSTITELQCILGDFDSSLIAFRTNVELPRLQTLYCLSVETIKRESVDKFINKLVSLRSLRRLGFSLGYEGTPEDEKYSLNALGRLPHIEDIEFKHVNLKVFSRLVANLLNHMDAFRVSDPDESPLFPKVHKLSFVEFQVVPFKTFFVSLNNATCSPPSIQIDVPRYQR